MFTIVPDIKYIEATKDEILELYRSANESLVQIPGRQGEDSEAYLISLNKGGELQIYLYFFMKESIEGIVYKYTEPITKSNYMEARDQGLYFLESMGFIMENTDFRKLPDKEKINLMNSIPPFHPDLSKFAPKKEKKEAEDEEEGEIEVEVLEEDLETIHEIGEEEIAEVIPLEDTKPSLTPEMIQNALKNDRNLRIFFLFLAGF